MNDDTFSLLSWLKSEELISHNKAAKSITWQMDQVYTAEEKTFRRVIDKIEKNPVEFHRRLIKVTGEEVF
jgi:hypothetical protein